MKKTRFIALVLAVAVMLIGAGYAWWSETVTITNEISTGNLDVKVSAPETYTGYWVETSPIPQFGKPNYIADPVLANLVNGENDEILLKFDNLYPGAFVGASIPVLNNGTLAVRLDRIIADDIGTNGLKIIAVTGISDDEEVYPYFSRDFDGFYRLGNDLAYGNYYYPGDDFILEPGDTAYIIVSYTVDVNETGNEETTATFTLQPQFNQFNKLY